MTVGYDTTSTATPASTGTTMVWTHALASTATDIVVVASCPVDSATLTAKVGATPMVSQGKVHSNASTSGFVQVFGLTTPPTGSQTITVTSSATFTSAATAGAMSFTGSGGYGTVFTASGSSAAPAVTVSSTTSGNMIAAGAAAGVDFSASGNTSRFLSAGDFSSAAGNSAGATAASTGSSVAMSWTLTGSDWWGAVAFEVVASGAAPAPIPDVIMAPMRGF